MSEVHVPDVPRPSYPLCWAHNPLMVHCDRKAGHSGLHSWEYAQQLAQLREWKDAACKTMQDYVRNAEQAQWTKDAVARKVEAAYREGYHMGVYDEGDGNKHDADAAWLASEARKGVARDNG